MKELYLSGIHLEKDLRFCQIVDEIERNPLTYVIGKGAPCLIHEMKTEGTRRTDTGITHIGFDFYYVTFIYRGMLFNVEPASFYPFTDENDPGMFNFVPYTVSRTRQAQLDYKHAYEDLGSIDAYLESETRRTRPLTLHRQIFYSILDQDIAPIVAKFGGNRERTIWDDCFCIRSETWSNEHKVVECLSLQADPDGHRDAFMVDLVTKRICG